MARPKVNIKDQPTVLSSNYSHVSQCLKATYGLYVKTQLCHWNVHGAQFQALHNLFESQYEDLFQAMDLIAEHIRAQEIKIQPRWMTNEMHEDIDAWDAQTMIKALIADHEKIIASLNNAIEHAKKSNDEATIHLCSERCFTHQKHAWMLRSSLN